MGATVWNREELILAFNLYCKIPLGRIHTSNPQIIAVANVLRRTQSAVLCELPNGLRAETLNALYCHYNSLTFPSPATNRAVMPVLSLARCGSRCQRRSNCWISGKAILCFAAGSVIRCNVSPRIARK